LHLRGQNTTLFALTDAKLRQMRRRTEAGIGSSAGIAPTLSERLLYPRIAAEVVALPKSSALCQFRKRAFFTLRASLDERHRSGFSAPQSQGESACRDPALAINLDIDRRRYSRWAGRSGLQAAVPLQRVSTRASSERKTSKELALSDASRVSPNGFATNPCEAAVVCPRQRGYPTHSHEGSP
jgi:hypothetical protein